MMASEATREPFVFPPARLPPARSYEKGRYENLTCSKPFFNKDLRHRGVRGVRSAERSGAARRGVAATYAPLIVSALSARQA